MERLKATLFITKASGGVHRNLCVQAKVLVNHQNMKAIVGNYFKM